MKARIKRVTAFRALLVVAAALGTIVAVNDTPAWADTSASNLSYPDAGAPCQFGSGGGASCTNPNDANDKYDWYVDENGDNKYSGSSENLSPRLYYYRSCTDYVAWKLESLGVATSKTRGRGNGGDWDDNLPSGVVTSSVPEIGDAAVWQLLIFKFKDRSK